MDDKYLTILMEMKQSIGSLHSKVDSQSVSLVDHIREDELVTGQIKKEISSLNETRSEAKGSYAAIIVGVAAISSLVTMLAHALTGK